jgi:hypothetical protein
MTDAASAETFTPHIGKAVWLPGGQTLTLIAVDQASLFIPGAAPRAGFSLLLRGACAPIAPEGMHRIILEGGASFELYLIPIHTPSRDHQDYQIVFN